MRPQLLITLGDPHSVNLECLQTCFQKINLDTYPLDISLIGSAHQLEWQERHILQTQIPSNIKLIPLEEDLPDIREFSKKNPLDLSATEKGVLAFEALLKAKKIISEQPTDQLYLYHLLTCPITKPETQKAGLSHPGQTEFCASFFGNPDDGLMLLAGPKLKVALVTQHEALANVSERVTPQLIEKKILSLHQAIKTLFNVPSPRIAVCGLNPHCGDKGAFGREEIEVIEPVIDQLRKKTPIKELQINGTSLDIVGPLPADTVFHEALQGAYDGILAMYHDQGLGPFKTIHFYDGINITAGIPFLRVSPDHGPARNLFGKNQSKADSFRACFEFIENYTRRTAVFSNPV